jgi:hypothetical protein
MANFSERICNEVEQMKWKVNASKLTITPINEYIRDYRHNSLTMQFHYQKSHKSTRKVMKWKRGKQGRRI